MSKIRVGWRTGALVASGAGVVALSSGLLDPVARLSGARPRSGRFGGISRPA